MSYISLAQQEGGRNLLCGRADIRSWRPDAAMGRSSDPTILSNLGPIVILIFKNVGRSIIPNLQRWEGLYNCECEVDTVSFYCSGQVIFKKHTEWLKNWIQNSVDKLLAAQRSQDAIWREWTTRGGKRRRMGGHEIFYWSQKRLHKTEQKILELQVKFNQ